MHALDGRGSQRGLGHGHVLWLRRSAEGKHSKIPLSPDLKDKSFWQFALGYTLRSPSGAQALYLLKCGQSDELVEAFTTQFEKHFSDLDTLRRGFRDNFVENIATLEATKQCRLQQIGVPEQLLGHLLESQVSTQNNEDGQGASPPHSVARSWVCQSR